MRCGPGFIMQNVPSHLTTNSDKVWSIISGCRWEFRTVLPIRDLFLFFVMCPSRCIPSLGSSTNITMSTGSFNKIQCCAPQFSGNICHTITISPVMYVNSYVQTVCRKILRSLFVLCPWLCVQPCFISGESCCNITGYTTFRRFHQWKLINALSTGPRPYWYTFRSSFDASVLLCPGKVRSVSSCFPSVAQ